MQISVTEEANQYKYLTQNLFSQHFQDSEINVPPPFTEFLQQRQQQQQQQKQEQEQEEQEQRR